jgi:hypothetical protein
MAELAEQIAPRLIAVLRGDSDPDNPLVEEAS